MTDLAAIVRAALALIFLTAALAKLRNPRAFAEAVSGYRVVPQRASAVTAYILLLAEPTVGLALLVGFHVKFALLAAATLLGVFAAGAATSLLRGARVECGCLGTMASLRIGWLSVAANLTLATAAAVAAASQPVLGAPLPVTAAGGSPDELMIVWAISVLVFATYWLALYAESVLTRVEEAIAFGE